MVIISIRYIILLMANKKFRMASNIGLRDIIKILIEIVYIITILYVIYQVIKGLLGGTWATENIIIAGMGVILAGMFVIVGFLINQSKCLGKIEERTINIVNSLSSLGKDFKEHIKDHKK